MCCKHIGIEPSSAISYMFWSRSDGACLAEQPVALPVDEAACAMSEVESNSSAGEENRVADHKTRPYEAAELKHGNT